MSKNGDSSAYPIKMPCVACDGAGWIDDDECSACNGLGGSYEGGMTKREEFTKAAMGVFLADQDPIRQVMSHLAGTENEIAKKISALVAQAAVMQADATLVELEKGQP